MAFSQISDKSYSVPSRTKKRVLTVAGNWSHTCYTVISDINPTLKICNIPSINQWSQQNEEIMTDVKLIQTKENRNFDQRFLSRCSAY